MGCSILAVQFHRDLANSLGNLDEALHSCVAVMIQTKISFPREGVVKICVKGSKSGQYV